jgi:hypothetical protein
MPQTPLTINRLDIPGNRDEAVEKYCAWQQGQVMRVDHKADYQKACNYLIDKGMDLELIYQDPNVASDLETKLGIKRGIAWRVVGDVGYWVKKYKQDKTQDQAE